MKLPIFKRTYEFYKRFGSLWTFGKLAQISGVEMQTAEAWGRPVESDEFPTGTGKRNPTDTVLRQIRTIHAKDAGTARVWANTFPKYVDHLDALSGKVRAQIETGSLCQIIGESAKEHLDIVLAFMNADEPDYENLEHETLEAISKLNELLACLRESAKAEVEVFAGLNGREKAVSR